MIKNGGNFQGKFITWWQAIKGWSKQFGQNKLVKIKEIAKSNVEMIMNLLTFFIVAQNNKNDMAETGYQSRSSDVILKLSLLFKMRMFIGVQDENVYVYF